MKDVEKNKDTKSTNRVSPVVAGIAGAVAGGMAVAAAIVMSDKKNQKKVKDAIVDAKDKVTKYAETIKSQPLIEKSAHKLEKAVKSTKQKIEEHT